MTTYQAIYTLGTDEIYKDIQAPTIEEAKKKAAAATMLPNEFFHNYEGMEVYIQNESGDVVGHMTYNDIKTL